MKQFFVGNPSFFTTPFACRKGALQDHIGILEDPLYCRHAFTRREKSASYLWDLELEALHPGSCKMKSFSEAHESAEIRSTLIGKTKSHKVLTERPHLRPVQRRMTKTNGTEAMELFSFQQYSHYSQSLSIRQSMIDQEFFNSVVPFLDRRYLLLCSPQLRLAP